ncbi:MAG: hypothetical protein KatS3mg111_1627 [Pirellulaceae bacterium]|nr:MAG: hypothetical protein KatS3mg111_1627 [Pirellulaceae bacterium]
MSSSRCLLWFLRCMGWRFVSSRGARVAILLVAWPLTWTLSDLPAAPPPSALPTVDDKPAAQQAAVADSGTRNAAAGSSDGSSAEGADQWLEVGEGERLFALEVFPTLEAKCFACHGGDRRAIESGLDLTSLAATIEGGDAGYPVLVPR